MADGPIHRRRYPWRTVVVSLVLSAAVWGGQRAAPDWQEVETHERWLLGMMRQGRTDTGPQHLIQSYENLENRCWIYDQALAVITFAALGHVDQADEIMSTLGEIQNDDGSFYFSYLISSLEPTSERTYTGTNAWVAMAVNFYRRLTGNQRHNRLLLGLLSWLASRQVMDAAAPTHGGLSLGTRDDAFSMEHNLDAFSAFFYTGNHRYRRRAKAIRRFIFRELYRVDPSPHFITGYRDSSLYLDCQSWAVLSFGKRFARVLDFAETRFSVENGRRNGEVDIRGFFERQAEGAPVWSEGTEGMAMAYGLCSQTDKSLFFHRQVARMKGVNGGIAYATENDHGFSPAPSVAGTTWYLFFELKLNPFAPDRSQMRAIRRLQRAVRPRSCGSD